MGRCSGCRGRFQQQVVPASITVGFQNIRQDLQAEHVPIARLPKDAPDASQLVLEQRRRLP
jgi:hypothetical protein